MPILAKRLREPSTWAGFAVLLSLTGLSHEDSKALADLLAAAAAAVSILAPEKG